VEALVGPFDVGEECFSGCIRRFYTSTYKSLDQFDQLWYECCYDKRDKRWETCYTWAVILDCVINARSAFCENVGESEPLRTFIVALINVITSVYK
jgi:hypothetical protein